MIVIMIIQTLKYQLQSGTITPINWKKRLESSFRSNKYHRSLCIVESLTTEQPRNFKPFRQNISGVEWKK